MKLLVGLGNPGKKYEKNRHNTGMMFLDHVYNMYGRFIVEDGHNAQYGKWKKFESSHVCFLRTDVGQILLIKPQTYMNNSGIAISYVMNFYKIKMKKLLIVHDDLDMNCGAYKIQMGKGPHVHNGITSIEKALHTSDFWRIRIGIDNRDPENRIPGDAYVLQDFSIKEKNTIKKTFDKIVDDSGFQLFVSTS